MENTVSKSRGLMGPLHQRINLSSPIVLPLRVKRIQPCEHLPEVLAHIQKRDKDRREGKGLLVGRIDSCPCRTSYFALG